MKVSILIWGSLCLVGAGALRGPREDTVHHGEDLSVTCYYDDDFQCYVTYWCKGENRETCDILIESTDRGSVNQYSMEDNRSWGRFTITRRQMRPEDSDTHLCTIERIWRDKMHAVRVTAVRVTVLPVMGKPEITIVTSMKSNKIRWELSEGWGKITRFQMNISAWRDYNVSFSEDKSFQFAPNVTEYEIPLQYGTNYTITLQEFTSAGAGTVTTQEIETDIGDPPLHMEKTMHVHTLQLHPVLNLNGPIRSYEILVFGGQEDNSTKACLKFKNTPYNSSWTPIRYTAAVLPAETLTGPRPFILGDNYHYNGFHNAPLIPNHNYTVYIRVISHWNHVEKSSCAFAGFLQNRKDGSFVIVSISSFGLIITMLSLTFLALVGFGVIPLTPRMGRRNPAEKKQEKITYISIDDETNEVLEEAKNRI